MRQQAVIDVALSLLNAGAATAARGIPEMRRDAVIAFRKSRGKEKRLGAGHSPLELRRLGTEIEAIARLLRICRIRGYLDMTGGRRTGAEIKMERCGQFGRIRNGCRPQAGERQIFCKTETVFHKAKILLSQPGQEP